MDILLFADSTTVADSIAVVVQAIPQVAATTTEALTNNQQVEFYKAMLKSQEANYKSIIESQASTYEMFIYILLAIFALFSGATFIYNKWISKSFIKKQALSIFNAKEEKLSREIKIDFDSELKLFKNESNAQIDTIKQEIAEDLASIKDESKIELHKIKGESARIFAITAREKEKKFKKPPVLSTKWWESAVSNYIIGNFEVSIGIAVTSLADNLDVALENKYEFKKEYFEKYGNFDALRKLIKTIPNTLNTQKRKIKKYIKEIEEAKEEAKPNVKPKAKAKKGYQIKKKVKSS